MLQALWAGETVAYHGEFHQLSGAAQAPGPLGRIPVVIGGAGPATLALVREFADWWNVQVTQLHRLEQAREQVGGARVSVQQIGVERVYAWFCDFAPPDTLAAFGAEVIGPLAARDAPGTAAGREEACQ